MPVWAADALPKTLNPKALGSARSRQQDLDALKEGLFLCAETSRLQLVLFGMQNRTFWQSGCQAGAKCPMPVMIKNHAGKGSRVWIL
jgi:hypothetical protein